VYNGVWGKSPEAGEFSRIFVLKYLAVCRLHLTVSYRKNWGNRMYYTCSPNNFVGGATAPAALPVLAPMPRDWGGTRKGKVRRK